jgi:hypothetical protein
MYWQVRFTCCIFWAPWISKKNLELFSTLPVVYDAEVVLMYHVLSFFAYYFLKVHIHNFSKIKGHKEVSKQ